MGRTGRRWRPHGRSSPVAELTGTGSRMVASHLSGPELHTPGSRTLHRVGRSDRPLALSQITVEDAAQPRAGNRFDVLGSGVLYLGTTPQACYAETLARLRPTTTMRALLKDEDPQFMVCGAVPRDWRTRRLQVAVTVAESLPFVDVAHPRTHEYLTTALAEQLSNFGIGQLDVSDVRGRNRLLTRAIASWVYAATDAEGSPEYSGIRYLSRLGEHECWAVFDGWKGTDYVPSERGGVCPSLLTATNVDPRRRTVSPDWRCCSGTPR